MRALRKFLLIYNPLSGNADFKNKLDEVIHCFLQKQCFVIPARITPGMDTPELVSLAGEIGAEGIIISGGDGTIHQVINAMLQLNVDLPIGIIPSGTSNDFANYLNLNDGFYHCAELVADGRADYVDIGEANGRYFINVASGGLLTSAAHNTDTAWKNTLGKVAYYLKGIEELPNFRGIKARITADETVFDREIFLFLVMNSGTVGSFSDIAPKACLNDGKLDLLIVHKCGIPELMRLFINFLTGKHIYDKNVIYMQAEKIKIECREAIDSDLDGEIGPAMPLDIRTVAKKIRIYGNR